MTPTFKHRPVTRMEDLIPDPYTLADLRFLAQLPPPWLEVRDDGDDRFTLHYDHRLDTHLTTFRILKRLGGGEYMRPNDLCSMYAAGELIRQGLRVCRPTDEQYESLQHVSVELELKDYEQPFPAMLVETPLNPVYRCVACCRMAPGCLCLVLNSRTGEDDIITMVKGGKAMERSLEKLDEGQGLEPLLPHTLAAQRAAVNMMLALVNFGCAEAPMFPKQYAEDKGWAKEDTERGQRAKLRVKEAPHLVSFTRTVVIRRGGGGTPGGPTGRYTAPHWVRGHWKMQPCGAGLQDRKRILIRPYMTGLDGAGDPSRAVPPTVYVDRRVTGEV